MEYLKGEICESRVSGGRVKFGCGYLHEISGFFEHVLWATWPSFGCCRDKRWRGE